MSTTAPQARGLKRTNIQEHDLGLPGRQVIQNRVDISPDAPLFRHKHPGEEVIYVLEGSLQYDIDGQPPTTVSAREGLVVPAETVHAVKNIGTGNAASSPRTSSRKESHSSLQSTELRGLSGLPCNRIRAGGALHSLSSVSGYGATDRRCRSSGLASRNAYRP